MLKSISPVAAGLLRCSLTLGVIALVSTTTFAAELKYSIAPDFFEQNPGHKPLGPCHGGVVLDKAGNIYVTTDTERGIVVLSPKGRFLRAFGPTRTGAMGQQAVQLAARGPSARGEDSGCSNQGDGSRATTGVSRCAWRRRS